MKRRIIRGPTDQRGKKQSLIIQPTLGKEEHGILFV